ncbi:MAG: MotA/TolQ/ExbB proton channel family protein [Pseudomonadota bacterium]|uniref:Biopolymer transport protein, TolQ n=1 Tax=Methylophaga aminisulfidivorans MP TaxID=1026882 RepID=F5SVJ8_9GAMM|nr:MotA/TolQ/ExbB proton channel family protein [Methylophaga aminisulfidivorans]EGL55878.1 biopolymer transport protein, TolQ [Methylophaga aminisulfidivorans MP]MEC9411981.1 MotA/TolQ/ExbB proton channel family protein [Pseudomonadota bacterium]
MAQENDAVSAAENIGNSADTATNVDSAANADPSAVTTGITDALNGTDVSTLTQQQPDALMSQFAEFMHVGGPVVWILTGFSVIALAIVLIKLWQFMSTRPESAKHLKSVIRDWQKGDAAEAMVRLNPKRPVDELVLISIRGLTQHKMDLATLKEELDRVATLRLNQLRAYLRPLEVIATLSPLLGLLGTVLGMIVAFQQMEAAGNQVDPSVLSGGIWQALLTTAVGLAVAIPVVTVHNWMERKVERVAALMNDTVTQIFTVERAQPVSADNKTMRHAA